MRIECRRQYAVVVLPSKWQVVQEGTKSGNVPETCRRHGNSPSLLYRWRDEAELGAKAALGGKRAAAGETEKDQPIRPLERTLGRKSQAGRPESGLSVAAERKADG